MHEGQVLCFALKKFRGLSFVFCDFRGSGTAALVVKTTYNTHGYPQSLKRASDGYHYVTVQAMDAFGHATVLHEGNGVTVTRGFDQATGLALSTVAGNNLLNTTVAHLTTSWDGFGNLATRADAKNASTQTASYDDLNRLVSTTLDYTLNHQAHTLTRSYQYDPTGNRTQACKNATCTHYGYGESGYGPHALTRVNGSTAGYAYNANGEMTTDNDKTLTWSAFGKVTQITGPATVTFTYGPDQTRIKKHVTQSNETVLYLQGAEKLTINGQASIRRTLAFAGVTITDTGGAQNTLLYAIKDHLGSPLALIDADGNVSTQMSFSPFGQRRTLAWRQPMSSATAWAINTTQTDRGYTGQESLDAVGLVDYNARLYDPALGRFLSVDPLIAHPGSTQSINPYSYVENNPLNKTDPTGMASQCTGSGDDRVCTITKTKTTVPTGSHIPQHTKVTVHTKGDKVTGVTTSGQGAMPGGRIATSMDGNSWMGFTATKAKNSTGKTNVNTHQISAQQEVDLAPTKRRSDQNTKSQSNVVSKNTPQKNLAKAREIFVKLYKSGKLKGLDYDFIENFKGGIANKAFSFKYIDKVKPGEVAEMDIYSYKGATVYRGGAKTLRSALNTVAHEIYHLNPRNQKLWKSGNKIKMETAQLGAETRAFEVVDKWEEMQ